MSPEYETSLPSPVIEKQQTESKLCLCLFDRNFSLVVLAIEEEEEQQQQEAGTPPPVRENVKKSASPRRLRPRKANERSAAVDNQHESTDLPTRTASVIHVCFLYFIFFYFFFFLF